MKPASFDYFSPETLEEALNLKEKFGEEAKFIAGGQSLVPAMNFRVSQPAMLIDLNMIDGMDRISMDSGKGLKVGGLVRQRKLETDLLVKEHTPLIHDVMPFIAHPQIRNRGTLGGCLAYADPAAELPMVSVLLQARIHLQSKKNSRWVMAEDFFHGIFSTDIQADELIREVLYPKPPPRTVWGFDEFSRRRGDYALMGVAAQIIFSNDLVCENARIVYLNAGDRPFFAAKTSLFLNGKSLNEEIITEASQMAAKHEIEPFGNPHASVDYQRHLAYVLTRRVLKKIAMQAPSGSME